MSLPKSRPIYLPPPNQSMKALKVLGVYLKNGPPKDWREYENLLNRRLGRLSQDERARAALVNELVNEGLLDEDPLDGLVDWLWESNHLARNLYFHQAWLYLRDPKQRKKLLKEGEKDPRYLRLSEKQKRRELESVSIWEWWSAVSQF